MSPTRHALSLAVVAGALFPAASPSDRLAFRPEPGSRLTKTFTTENDFTLDDLSVTVDGEDVGSMLGTFEFTVVTRNEIKVTDTYVSVAGGRPEELRRVFDALDGSATVSMATQFGGEDQEVVSSSELEGVTVVFSWDDEEDQYEVSLADEGGDDELLDGLTEDMDLRALLPEGEVSVGDTWEVPLAELEGLVAPGGNLKLLPEDMEAEDFGDLEVLEELVGDEFEEYLERLLDGTCVCTYEGQEEEDGLAEVLVAIEIDSSADLTEALERLFEVLAEELGEEFPISVELAELTIDFEGEGVLSWDVEAGRIASFDLSGDLIIGVDLGMSIEYGGENPTVEVSLEMSGTHELSVETEE